MISKYAPDITPRHLIFSYSKNSVQQLLAQDSIHYYHFITSAILLPTLENMLVMTVKKSLPHIQNKRLKQQATSLIAQEAIHGYAFNQLIKKLHAETHLNVDDMHYFRKFRHVAYSISKRFPGFPAALCAAGEHFTAVHSALYLSDQSWLADFPTDIAALSRWHCIEEIEHKSVAFDVYQHLHGSYMTRVSAMFLMTFTILWVYTISLFRLLRYHRNKSRWQSIKQIFVFYCSRKGLIRPFFKSYLAYYQPNFHPENQKTDHLIHTWIDYFAKIDFKMIPQQLTNPYPPCDASTSPDSSKPNFGQESAQ